MTQLRSMRETAVAGADYLLCSVCSAKTVYDAELDYDTGNLAQIAAICTQCAEKGYKLVTYDPTPVQVSMVKVHTPTRGELAQALYESRWPNCQLEDALPEVRDNFYALADTASQTLARPLED